MKDDFRMGRTRDEDHRPGDASSPFIGAPSPLSRRIVYLLVLCTIIFLPNTYAQEFKIIANSSLKAPRLTEQELRLVYLGKKKRWSDGHKITLTYLDDSKTLNCFSHDVLSKTRSQFLMFWKRRLFTGKGAMPRSFKSEAALVNYVRNHPGAIGFVSGKTDVKDVTEVKLGVTRTARVSFTRYVVMKR